MKIKIKNIFSMQKILKAVLFLSSSVFAQEKEYGPIVFIWAPYGNGHKAAAQGLEAQIKKLHPDRETIHLDFTTLMPKKLADKSIEGFEWVTRYKPNWYHWGFESFSKYSGKKETSADIARGPGYPWPTRKLGEKLQELKPSLVIGTIPQAVEMLDLLKKENVVPRTLPIAWQHTDFFANDYVRALTTGPDIVFSPSASITRSLVADYHVPREKLITTGIAINPLAREVAKWDTPQKEEFLRSQQIDPSKPLVTIFSGGNGIGNFPEMVQQLQAWSGIGKELQIVAITAKNKLQFEKLEALKKILPPNIKLHIKGFTKQDEVFGLLKSSSLWIGKAGGISSTEAFTLGVPAILLDINGGQETYNIRHFEEQGLGIGVKNESGIASVAIDLLENPEKREAMIEKQRVFAAESFKPEAFEAWYQSIGDNQKTHIEAWSNIGRLRPARFHCDIFGFSASP